MKTADPDPIVTRGFCIHPMNLWAKLKKERVIEVKGLVAFIKHIKEDFEISNQLKK